MASRGINLLADLGGRLESILQLQQSQYACFLVLVRSRGYHFNVGRQHAALLANYTSGFRQ